MSQERRDYAIIGIDVGKEKLSFFERDSQTFFEIPNTKKDLKKLLKKKKWNPSSVMVGLEATEDYSVCAMQTFVREGFLTILLNPLITRKYTRVTIRNKKIDKSDDQLITDMLLMGEGREVSENDLDIAKKALLRVERKLMSLTFTLKLLEQSLLSKKENDLSVLPALREVRKLIKAMEQSSERILSDVLGDKQSHQEEIIDSHPGFAQKLSAIVSAEAGDISRFPNAKAFNAYVGLDPRVIQSGSKDARGKMTKRGNAYLRHAFYLASATACRYDEELRAFYDKKRSEGKHHAHALCAVSRKICGRIYALVTQDRMYEVRPLENAERA